MSEAMKIQIYPQFYVQNILQSFYFFFFIEWLINESLLLVLSLYKLQMALMVWCIK